MKNQKQIKFITYDAFNRISPNETNRLTNFLFTHLEEYRDPKISIRRAIQYAAKERPGLGGEIFVTEIDGDIVGAVVVNRTGMADYIPENILVYIATHKEYRGKGIGEQLLNMVIKNCKGDIALHVAANNPAKSLFEKLGFTNPYLEIREGESIERAIKRYKRKCKNVKLKEKVREKKHYIKKSVRRREEIKKAQYREKYLNKKNRL